MYIFIKFLRKEIVVICAVTSVLFHISICRLRNNSISKNELNFDYSKDNLQTENSNYITNQNNTLLEDSKNISTNENLMYLKNNKSNESQLEIKSRFFDDFHNISLIGRGGFGHVYRCQHNIDHKEYAIKQINIPLQDISPNPIYREVHALANLEHPNILRYYHSWIEKNPKWWYKKKTLCNH